MLTSVDVLMDVQRLDPQLVDDMRADGGLVVTSDRVIAYHFPGNELETPSLAYPEDLDDAQKANCVALYSANGASIPLDLLKEVLDQAERDNTGSESNHSASVDDHNEYAAQRAKIDRLREIAGLECSSSFHLLRRNMTAQERLLYDEAVKRNTPPDEAFRDHNTVGSPASGPFQPFKGDAFLWADRLGLEHPDKWGDVVKYELRRLCNDWLAQNK